MDWSRTRAYALGIGSVYLNLKGREAHGIVESDRALPIADAIAGGLAGLVDPERGAMAIRGAVTKRGRHHVNASELNTAVPSVTSTPMRAGARRNENAGSV